MTVMIGKKKYKTEVNEKIGLGKYQFMIGVNGILLDLQLLGFDNLTYKQYKN